MPPNAGSCATGWWISSDTPRPVHNLIQTLDRVQDAAQQAEPPADPLPLTTLEEILDKSLPDGPEAAAIHANILLALGLLYWRRGSRDQALHALETAREISAMHDQSALAEQCCEALRLVEAGQSVPDQAEAGGQQTDIPWTGLAQVLSAHERNEEAASVFRKAIENDPQNDENWTGLGQVYLKLNLQQNAVAAFQEALELAPNADCAWLGLASAYQSGNQPELAVQAWQHLVELNPASSQAWLELAAVHAAKEQTEAAIQAYSKAAELDPGRPCTWKELGSLYIKTGAYEASVQAFEKLAALRPDCGFALSSLAYARYKCGQYDQAAELFEKSIPLFDDQRSRAAIWYRLGDTYRKRREFDNALAAYKQAELLLQPQAPQAAGVEIDTSPSMAASAELLLQPQATQEASVAIDTSPSMAASAEVLAAGQPEVPSAGQGQLAEDAQPLVEAPVAEALRMNEAAADAEDAGLEFEAEERIEEALFAVTLDDQPQDIFGLEPVEQATAGEAQPLRSAQVGDSLPVSAAVDAEPGDYDRKNAVEWNALGNQFVKAGAFDNAIAAYTKAIELEPEFNWPYISNLAMAHYQKGKARGQNNAGVQQNPDLWEAEEETGLAQAVLEADLPVPERGEAVTEELLQPAAEPYEQKEMDVWLAQLEERVAAAEAAAGQEAELQAEQAAPCACLAEAALDIPEDAPLIVPQDAAPLVEIPANLIPDDSDALNITPADQVLVETVVEEEVSVKPGNSIDWNELGNAYTRNGAYEDAIHAYKQSIRLNPRYGSPYSNLGFVYFHKGEYQIAISLYKKSLQLLESAEDKATCWNRLGDTYRRMRDYHNAMKAYEKAGNMDPVTTPLLSRARIALMSNAAD